MKKVRGKTAKERGPWPRSRTLERIFSDYYRDDKMVANAHVYGIAFYWWAQGVVDERRQRGDYRRLSRKPAKERRT